MEPLLLLWSTAVVAMMMGTNAKAVEQDPLGSRVLKVIPHNSNKTLVTKLVMKNNMITLNEEDQTALATYPTLEELYLDSNLVTAIPAKYFSVVPKLRVLSLSSNNLSRLDPEAFFGLKALTNLDLSQNLLSGFPSDLFRGLNRLKTLKLQKNPWNCSCPLLISIQTVKQAKVDIGAAEVTCASPEAQAGQELLNATAVCYPSPSYTVTEDTPVNSQQLNTTLLPTQNHRTDKDQTPALGNAWKFTICVVALALTTSMLIALAIKGPSWYKLYHNYRHRRLDREAEGGMDAGSTGPSTRYLSHQTFTFQQGNDQTAGEEDWDEYFEDPYIKREEVQTGEENLSEP
ncbi:leucine-rich repeat-containing protein 19-like [Betta splendens]|uniref:Leucine-rich repeat-containing protein 19-like n=1 Tax=Betta splendens TaxID=158456 RepID=A0A6P7ME15_BETSP|nr:leucine-rich repeat-containing protein 19-like [Betta splendens]